MTIYTLVDMREVIGERLREGIGPFASLDEADQYRLRYLADPDAWAIVRTWSRTWGRADRSDPCYCNDCVGVGT
jgi:hypothetical protein